MSSSTLIAGFVISTIGFGFFMYGKKQHRPLQLSTGVLMMGAPFITQNPLWMIAGSLLLLAGLRVALNFEG